MNEEDLSLINQVMNSTFLTTGPVVSEFEKKFSAYFSIPEVIALNSCTGAIHIALLRKNIGPGDEVITTPMTFVATATAILQTGATPIFVDICPRTGLLLPEKVDSAIGPKTRAIVVVHLYGNMVDMMGFSRLAAKHGLSLIEDSAHCIEGIRDGIRPGQLSDAACFSFYATKSITCGEGGAIACKSKEDTSWYRSAIHHGISKNAYLRYTTVYEHWDMRMMGWKYNMSDIQAALLIGQIGRLDGYVKRRRTLEKLYRELLSGVDGLDILEGPKDGELGGDHLFTILTPKELSRDEVLQGMQEEGIGCAVNYRAVHTLTYFREKFGYSPEDFPVAHEIGNRTISLPLYPKLRNEDVRWVCEVLKRVLIRCSKNRY